MCVWQLQKDMVSPEVSFQHFVTVEGARSDRWDEFKVQGKGKQDGTFSSNAPSCLFGNPRAAYILLGQN